MRINLKNGELVEITVKQGKEENRYDYYIGSIKIGVLDTEVMEENILILEKELKNEEVANEIKDAINILPREVIEQECEENKDIEELINERYGKLEEIGEIRKIEIREKQEENKEKESTEHAEDTKNATTNDINIKQSIDLGERANDMHDMRKWLGGQLPSEINRIGVVESYQMQDYGGKNTTRYSLVAIGKDGTVEPLENYIPQLKQRSSAGNNPREESYQIRTDGTAEKDAVLSEYEIGDKIIQLDNKEMGRIELNIGEEARNSTKTLTQEVRDENTTFATDRTQRSVVGEYEANGEDTVEKGIEEAEQHEKINPNCDKMTEKDVDGENAKSHVHNDASKIILENGKEVTFERLAVRWGMFKENGQPDAEHARNKYIEKQEQNLEKMPEEIVEDLDEEFEDPRVQDSRNH